MNFAKTGKNRKKLQSLFTAIEVCDYQEYKLIKLRYDGCRVLTLKHSKSGILVLTCMNMNLKK